MLNSRIKRGEKDKPVINRLPIVGKLKIGELVDNGNGKKYPRTLDHFRPYGKYESYFAEAFGLGCTNVLIIFIDDDPEYSCRETFEGRDSAGKLVLKSDGEKYYVYNTSSEKYEETDFNSIPRGLVVKTVLRLRFIIPKISGLLGVWEVNTSGEASSVQYLKESFDAVLESAGTVRNIPFELSVKMVKSQKPGDTKVFPVLALVPNISVENAETIKTFVTGGNLPKIGMLTDEKINQLKIDAPKIAGGE